MCTKFIEGYVCLKKIPPLKTPFKVQYRPSKKRHNQLMQTLLHEEIIALQCSSISIRKCTKCPTRGCGIEIVSTHKCRDHINTKTQTLGMTKKNYVLQNHPWQWMKMIYFSSLHTLV